LLWVWIEDGLIYAYRFPNGALSMARVPARRGTTRCGTVARRAVPGSAAVLNHQPRYGSMGIQPCRAVSKGTSIHPARSKLHHASLRRVEWGRQPGVDELYEDMQACNSRRGRSGERRRMQRP